MTGWQSAVLLIHTIPCCQTVLFCYNKLVYRRWNCSCTLEAQAPLQPIPKTHVYWTKPPSGRNSHSVHLRQLLLSFVLYIENSSKFPNNWTMLGKLPVVMPRNSSQFQGLWYVLTGGKKHGTYCIWGLRSLHSLRPYIVHYLHQILWISSLLLDLQSTLISSWPTPIFISTLEDIIIYGKSYSEWL